MTSIYANPLFHHDVNSVTVAIIAAIPATNTNYLSFTLLRSSLMKLIKTKLNTDVNDDDDDDDDYSKILNATYTVTDIEVTGYYPSCMFHYIPSLYSYICI